MGNREYHKLVRDHIPRIITESGKSAVTRILPAAEYRAALNAKLLEETNEYLASEDAEELADILEVIRAIAELNGISPDTLEAIRARKHEKNGGFRQRIYLESVKTD